MLAAASFLTAALAAGVERDTADAASFSAHVDNPWFPLKPGTRYVYRGSRTGSRHATW